MSSERCGLFNAVFNFCKQNKLLNVIFNALADI